ncbi:MAG TPA: ETC complex I subunit [Methylocystis sp.]|nr:ETC complex I subunit [Methylocystis sp.]
MSAKIFCPAPRATQSAPGEGKTWVLRYDPASPRTLDPLMGWTSSSDMKAQIGLKFATKEEAIAYAERQGVAYRVEEPKPALASRRLVSYADNFKTTRIGPWTH